MAEINPDKPELNRMPTEPARRWHYEPLPPGVTFKREEITIKHKIFVTSVLTMIITSLVTFYVPLFNGLLGGTFGGYHAGRMKRALGAALLTSIAVPGILAFAYSFDTPDFLRFFSGLSFTGWAILHVIGTFIGAVAGAASRPLVSGSFLQRAPASVSASRGPVPGVAPTTRATTTTEVVANPPNEPVRGE